MPATISFSTSHTRSVSSCAATLTVTEALPSPRFTLVTVVTELNGMMCTEPSAARSRRVRTDRFSTVPDRPDTVTDVADLHRVLQQQEDAGDQVAHQCLRAEADRHADDAGAGQQRADVHADLGQHHHAGDDHDGDRQRGAQQRQQRAQPRRACACASRASRARWRSTAALTASHTATASSTVTASVSRLDSTRRPSSVATSQSKVPSPQSCSRPIDGDGEDQRAGDAYHHGVIECEARLDPWIARHSIGTWRQRAVERSKDDDLREPCQHEHHDDAAEVAQHSRVAVLHLDRPGEPQRRQQQQRQPVPDARQPVSQRGDRPARVLRARAVARRTVRRCCRTMMPRKM